MFPARRWPAQDASHEARVRQLVTRALVQQSARETPDSRTMPGGASGRGHVSEELADLNRAIELDPAEAWAIAARGQAYLDPDDAETVGNRGQAYRLLGREEEAREDFARATELDPGSKPAGD